MPPDDSAPWTSRLRHGLRTNRAVLSVLILAVGALLTILAVASFTPLQAVAPFQDIDRGTEQPSANYNLIFVVVGPIVAIVGGYLVGAYFAARRTFEHLMLTKSKAEFLRHIPELEDLLWELTPVDEDRYEAKRGELRVRR